MKQFNLEINLDDEEEAANFIDKYGSARGRRLANKLGLKGKNSATLATNLSCYALNKDAAISCRKKGDIYTAFQYEEICDKIYKEISLVCECW